MRNDRIKGAVIVFSSLILACIGPDMSSARAEFAGGSGVADDPYLVATAGQLDNVRHHMDAHFRQTGDIDLTDYAQGRGWLPIGSRPGRDERFEGTYDGAGCSIVNLTIRRPEGYYVGLFSGLGSDAAVSGLSLKNVQIAGQEGVGALAGINAGVVTGCHVEGEIAGEVVVGGLAGINQGDVRQVSFSGIVSGGMATGGLAGASSGSVEGGRVVAEIKGGDVDSGGIAGSNSGEIRYSSAEIEVAGKANVGGIAGNNTGTIINSHVLGTVSGEDRVGGAAGTSTGRILHSYSAAAVQGESRTGGLVGKAEIVVNRFSVGGEVAGSYYDSEVAGDGNNGYGEARTTGEMMRKETFDAWDFERVWAIDEGESYPLLIRQAAAETEPGRGDEGE